MTTQQEPPAAEAPSLAGTIDATGTTDTTGTTRVTDVAAEPGDGRPPTVLPAFTPGSAVCAECLAELTDPGNRRHRHPFVSCAACGPRPAASGFTRCADCAREYEDPADRRFHAPALSCHRCGPTLRLHLDHSGRAALDTPVAAEADALALARGLLAAGAVVAVKGPGGYRLVCDAGNAAAVAVLRRRTGREAEPYAVMARDLATAARLARVGEAEADLLTGPERPVVLLRRHEPAGPTEPAEPSGSRLTDVQLPYPFAESAERAAPGSTELGVTLPRTALDHLLFGLPGEEQGMPVLVVTGGTRSGEPVLTDDDEARVRLAGVADGWLCHDLEPPAPYADAVVRVVDGVARWQRRGCALAVDLPVPVRPVLATGCDRRAAPAPATGGRAWLSAPAGDLEEPAARRAFGRAAGRLSARTGVDAHLLVCDGDPEARVTAWAGRHAGGREVRRVQQHHALVASVMAEHGLGDGSRVVGIALDDGGYGEDGTVWGGEVLVAGYDGYDRFAQLASVPLPGGGSAARRPYRTALAHLHAARLPWDGTLSAGACDEGEQALLRRRLEQGRNCARVSAMGRLADAVASLAGLCHRSSYDGQAAREMQWAAQRFAATGEAGTDEGGYFFPLEPRGDRPGTAELVADPGPLLAGVLADVRAGAGAGRVAARFHAAVVGLVRGTCAAARDRHGLGTVVLAGGCFADPVLLSDCVRALTEDGFTALAHRGLPPGHGALALGQLAVAARRGA